MAHYPLELSWQPLETAHHTHHLQCLLETIWWSTVPHTYVPSLLLNPRQKQQEYSLGVFFVCLFKVNHKSVACWLRLGLSTGRLMNRSGWSDKIGYRSVNLVEKKIYLSFLVTAAEPEFATGIYFLNSEQLRSSPVTPCITSQAPEIIH